MVIKLTQSFSSNIKGVPKNAEFLPCFKTAHKVGQRSQRKVILNNLKEVSSLFSLLLSIYVYKFLVYNLSE